MARVQWPELPSAVHRAVEAWAGDVLSHVVVTEGLTCSMAAVLETSAAGRVFVKGVPGGDDAGVAAQFAETEVAHVVTAASPRLLRHVVAGWDLLVFEWVDGRHADLSRASDRRLVAEALATVQGVPAPGELPQFAERFASVLPEADLDLLRGGYLLHTDTNPHNLLVAAGEHRAWVIDWAMAAAGPAWIDPAYTAVRIMEEGQPADVALGWLGQFANWREADPRAVEVFVTAVCRQWTAAVGEVRAVTSNGRFRHLFGGVGARR